MMTKNAMQLKALVKKVAAEKGISAQLVMQNYMLERLAERLSRSKYKYNFIVKGGFLISSLVGLATRTTMDIDTTITGFSLTHDQLQRIFEEICAMDVNDDVQFEFVGTSDIRETDDYPGIRVSLKANYSPMSVPLTVDVTTGDKITPSEIEHEIPLMFDDRNIQIMAYNLETILAEKLETILVRSVANTRPRDYYDVHILSSLYQEQINYRILKEAFNITSDKRGSYSQIMEWRKIMSEIRNSSELTRHWMKYRKDYRYAAALSFDSVCDAVEHLLTMIYP